MTAYGPHPSQVVDFHGPADAPVRVTLLHGGYWRERYDRTYLEPLARALAGLGARVALAEYRRVGGGGGWPATFDDVAQVVRSASGGRHVLLGHSAGGHLALWAAARLPGIDHVVAVAPVADLARARELALSDGAVDELLGGRYRPEADPMRLPAPECTVTLVHGTADTDVPVELSRRYARAVPHAVLRELDGADHFAPVTPGTEACETVLKTVRAAP
ncbi:alpha/beta hydrolase [Streptomyces morookaense]|uniref:alpha/beta hydrolase n=1 Tax=Streptomyces morookaense TaxID=1970 RepID=UPI0034044325